MAVTKQRAASTRDLKHRVLTCLHKLSDRDTHSAAAAELESIAKTLPNDSILSFLSSISATDAADKSPVRKQCVRLISLLSESHGDALSPHLSKLLSAVVRRLRDSDSTVRSACINATSSISSHITKPPFTSVVKPLLDSLVTEQDVNSQIGAALCLAAAIDGSPDPLPLYLKKLLPRLEKLLKCDSFKAKSAILTLIGSVIGAGAASSHQTLRNLVPCLVEVIGSEDWAARRAAAEALVKLATVEGEMLPEYKASCLKTFEAKRFDKVKIVRETLNQLVEVWKEIPDVSDEISSSPEQSSSSKEDPSDGRYPPGSKTSVTVTSGNQRTKKSVPANRSSLPVGSVAATAHKKSPPNSSDKKSGPAIFQKLDNQKPADWKIETGTAHGPSIMVVSEDDSRSSDEKGLEESEKVRSRFANSKVQRALLNWNADDKMLKCSGVRARSCFGPCHDESSESTVVVSDIAEDVYTKQKECEDLSLIHKQLVSIENQQSSLLDLLQKLMGSSRNGMLSLETRVQGLELALDEISYDLAMSTGRIAKVDSQGAACCKLPGAEFLSPKFWRRTEPRNSTSQFSSSGDTHPIAVPSNIANNDGNFETFKLQTRRLGMQRCGGFVVNPLAEIQSASHGISEVSSNRVLRNVRNAL